LHEFQHIGKNLRLSVSIITSLAVLTMLAEFYFHIVCHYGMLTAQESFRLQCFWTFIHSVTMRLHVCL
jgi:hypothetical protein